MVEVARKPETFRRAVASARVLMEPETARLIASERVAKGDVLGIARLAGIQAVKRTGELIPLCHPLRISGVDVELQVHDASVTIRAEVRAVDRTGVEMEALTAVAVAGLTVYDMCKAIDRAMYVSDVCLELKSGGKSGDWRR